MVSGNGGDLTAFLTGNVSNVVSFLRGSELALVIGGATEGFERLLLMGTSLLIITGLEIDSGEFEVETVWGLFTTEGGAGGLDGTLETITDVVGCCTLRGGGGG